jgi:8-oxo-dGTP pyrophosphatase MutT (NUDIX family)
MLTEAGLLLDPGHADATEATLALLHQHLRERGLILGWRDELFPVHALQCDAPWADPACAQQPGLALARIERAAARFWGTLTFGAHCNGYVADVQGCPSHLWIGQRALNKATDPGRFDNLIGGGVPAGQTPHETLLREGWEEAGLAPEQLTQAHAGSVLAVLRDVPEGLQREHLHVYDLQLPRSVEPVNQDGEVSAFHRMTIQQALDCAAQGRMTVDAALATLDFALRHNLLGAHALSPAQHGLWRALRAG